MFHVMGQENPERVDLYQKAQLLLPFAIRGLATLGVADALAAGPKPVEEIAEEVGADKDALYRTLRYAARKGVFEELPGREFAMTPNAECLRSDAPGSMRRMLMMGDDSDTQFGAFTRVVQVLRTGEAERLGPLRRIVVTEGGGPAADGQPPAESEGRQSQERPKEQQGEQQREQQRERPKGRFCRLQDPRQFDAVLDAVDFTSDGVVADIGGANGAMLGAILVRHPRVKGILFDRPQVVEDAPALLDALSVADRCQVIGGDMLEEVPSGADTYLMSNVLHSQPDERALATLANVRSVMAEGARLLIMEAVVNDLGDEDASAVEMDFMLMLQGPNRERTAAEHAALLARAGLRLAGVTLLASGFSVLEARPR
ncbi:methyltransferase [Streptomyces sp. NPDC050617]|uniref:methyltransferase n=1 Tax=Streptomyces sp. NPDC050617 TaxID=3154628 RepID=UPI0034182529